MPPTITIEIELPGPQIIVFRVQPRRGKSASNALRAVADVLDGGAAAVMTRLTAAHAQVKLVGAAIVAPGVEHAVGDLEARPSANPGHDFFVQIVGDGAAHGPYNRDQAFKFARIGSAHGDRPREVWLGLPQGATSRLLRRYERGEATMRAS